MHAPNGLIQMFNPLGRFVGSYPENARLQGPAGIAADGQGQHIFVADPPTRRILAFSPKEE